jgi:hypothetical protein
LDPAGKTVLTAHAKKSAAWSINTPAASIQNITAILARNYREISAKLARKIHLAPYII